MDHVIFGAGAVGIATAAALRERGERVRMVNRSGRAHPMASRSSAEILGDPDLPHTYTIVPDVGTALAELGLRDGVTVSTTKTLTTPVAMSRSCL